MPKPPLHVVQAYSWEQKTSWVKQHFYRYFSGYDDLRFYGSLHLHSAPPVASPLFTFRREILVICGIEHRLVESQKKMIKMSGVIPHKANKGIFPSRAVQTMWLSR